MLCPVVQLQGPCQGLPAPVTQDNGNKEAAACTGTFVICPSEWDFSWPPESGCSSRCGIEPQPGHRALKAACDVGLPIPRAGEGEQCVPVPGGSMGLLLQKEMALGFFPFKIAAGDPLSSGKLLLERDY